MATLFEGGLRAGMGGLWELNAAGTGHPPVHIMPSALSHHTRPFVRGMKSCHGRLRGRLQQRFARRSQVGTRGTHGFMCLGALGGLLLSGGLLAHDSAIIVDTRDMALYRLRLRRVRSFDREVIR